MSNEFYSINIKKCQDDGRRGDGRDRWTDEDKTFGRQVLINLCVLTSPCGR